MQIFHTILISCKILNLLCFANATWRIYRAFVQFVPSFLIWLCYVFCEIFVFSETNQETWAVMLHDFNAWWYIKLSQFSSFHESNFVIAVCQFQWKYARSLMNDSQKRSDQKGVHYPIRPTSNQVSVACLFLPHLSLPYHSRTSRSFYTPVVFAVNQSLLRYFLYMSIEDDVDLHAFAHAITTYRLCYVYSYL